MTGRDRESPGSEPAGEEYRGTGGTEEREPDAAEKLAEDAGTDPTPQQVEEYRRRIAEEGTEPVDSPEPVEPPD
ncbi:MAG TPA: hypothetical protein VIL00_05465 [Pseudonocardiaceae bacterium]